MNKKKNKEILNLKGKSFVIMQKNHNNTYNLRNLLTDNVKYNVPAHVVYLGFTKKQGVVRLRPSYAEDGFKIKLRKRR